MLSLRSGFSLLFLCLVLAPSVWASDKDCISLTRVEIDETRIFSKAEQQQRLASYLGKCINPELIRKLLNDISGFYLNQGLVTTRPYLEEQDIRDGQIEIRVLIGTIEAIVDADSGASNGKIATAFAFNDDILNLRELETSLEMIERLSSVTAEIEIRPGNQPGSSIVAIKTTESDSFRLELGANAQTDLDTQLSLRATLDNPFNINDILEYRHNSGEVRETYQSNRSQELSYSFPLGGYLFALSFSDIEFEQRVQGINESFLSDGESETEKLSVSKLITRGQAHKLTLAFALELKDSKSFFENEPIDVSSYKTSQAQLELQHLWLQPWGQLATRYSYHQGLDSFGARDDDYFTQDGAGSEARLQFEKFIIDSSLIYYLDDPSWYSSFQLYLHYSDDILFANDQLNLGSPFTVRGYSSALSGSNAWYLRSELSKRLHSVTNPFSDKTYSKVITLSVGLDYGEAKCEVDNQDVCGEIYGLGINLDIGDKNFSGRLHWGHPLKEIDDDIGDKDQYMLDLRWAF